MTLIGIYTRYSTRLVNEDRAVDRPWESANAMAKISFERLSDDAPEKQDFRQRGGCDVSMD